MNVREKKRKKAISSIALTLKKKNSSTIQEQFENKIINFKNISTDPIRKYYIMFQTKIKKKL